MVAHVAIPGPESKTPEWYAQRYFRPGSDRPVVFGASEASRCLNASKHGSALELYLVKRQEKQPADLSENEAVQAGNFLESGVLAWYEHKANIGDDGDELILEPSCYFHPSHSFMSATPDGIVQRTEDGEWLRSVDAKCSTFRRWDEFGLSDDKFGIEGTDQVPLDYLCQAMQQMAVLGVDVCDFPVLLDGRHLKIYTVHKNDDLIGKIIQAEAELAERIRDARPPEPNWTLSGTKELIRDLYGLESGQVVELTDEDFLLWQEYEFDGIRARDIESRRTEIKNKLLWKMQAAELGRFPGGCEKELRRCSVKGSVWTQKDVDEAASKIGQVKRAGHERLLSRKTK